MLDHRSSSDVKCSVLPRHFPHVNPLPTFVRNHFGIELSASSSGQPSALSDEQWRRLISTLVCTDAPTQMPTPGGIRSQTSSHTPIHEAVQEAQLQILANASARRDVSVRGKQDPSCNVLLKGYRRPNDRLESFRVTSTGRPGLINLYPNSMVTSLVLGKEWHYLFEKVEAERFVWLLVHTSIFVPLVKDGSDGSCFVQLTGQALSERPWGRSLVTGTASASDTGAAVAKDSDAAAVSFNGPKRKHNGESLEVQPNTHQGAPQPTKLGKRTRTFERVDSRITTRSALSAPDLNTLRPLSRTASASSGATAERKPSEIVIVRSRMFYARCSRNKAGRVEVGLPSVHVLPRSACPKELDKVLPSSTASSNTTYRTRPPARTPSLDSKPSRPHESIFRERRTRHLAKYVFPRQFGLHNVFTGARDFDTTTQPFRDYTVREVEIKALGAKRTPKVLKNVLPVLGKILARHDKLNYRALLDRCCPSRVPKGRLTAEERQQIVKDLAEVEVLDPLPQHDVPFRTVQRIDSQANQSKSQQTTATAHVKVTFELAPPIPRKPRYTNYAIPTTGQVVHFITLVTKSLLPRDLFGSLHNQKLVLNTIGEFVRLRRYESFNLHQIAQSFRFTDLDWTLPESAVKRNRRLTRQEAEQSKELGFELLYWLFDGLVIPLLRTTFYVTETAAYRNKVLYFRQDDWHVLSKPVMGQLKESIFEPLTRAEALSMMSSRKLGYSHVRLLPKETGVRPIVNLRRRSTKQVHMEQQASQGEAGKQRGKSKPTATRSLAKQRRESMILGQSINYILQSVFHILTYEKSQMLTGLDHNDNAGGGDDRGGMLSSSVFGPNEIYTQLKNFKQRLGQNSAGSKNRKLYFIKVDIRCAFDSIDQAKLLEIIERILSKSGEQSDAEGYRIHRFAKVMPAFAGKNAAPTDAGTKREFVRLARPDCDHIDFFDLASHLAVALHDVVFVDSVSYRYESTSLILKLLRQHITENLIKIGKEFYRQRVGIPQGSSLSTLLCSFFYADLEAQDPFLRSLRDGGGGRGRKSLLMRYTDDFLLITTSRRQAKQFYAVMRKGHPDYGCFISPEKTLANFDLLDTTSKTNTSTADPLIPRIYGNEFPWCGLTINTKFLGVSTDLARYKGIDLRDTLTVEYCRKPGAALIEKMIQSVKPRCHILFTDTALNSDRRAYANMYSSFLVAALKFTAYLGELRRFKMTFEAGYLFEAVQRLVKFTSRYIGSRASSAKAKLQVLSSEMKAGKRKRADGRRWGKRKRAAAWKVSCTVQPHYVHWLGYSAFLTVLSRQASKKIRDGSVKVLCSPYARSLDPETRQALMRLLESLLHRTSQTTARRRMAGIAAKALVEAQKSLQI
ncbi:uncharacterized protein UHO2_00683 [Ustilago hordei]|uniref:Telomerase reverse transcriptase n=1 Tax=Ustilago hordei TaxID=120017 RepID=I2FWG4_USTHO|nr:uncharacterized protein UHO2_00683 [Ustilago hordei]CCF51257.1 uncharacterized protein UHOR_01164 [Ustilago hordei]SYW82198.1 uncharacterized protein UHO2_00683 [Ustilago hordei]